MLGTERYSQDRGHWPTIGNRPSDNKYNGEDNCNASDAGPRNKY